MHVYDYRHAVSIGRSRLQAARRSIYPPVDDNHVHNNSSGDVVCVTLESRALMTSWLASAASRGDNLIIVSLSVTHCEVRSPHADGRTRKTFR